MEPGHQGGNSTDDIKREVKNLIKGGKGLVSKFLK
jgi:hypothetical protein